MKGNHLRLPKFDEACRNVDRRRPAALAQLHHELRKRLMPLLADLGGRVSPWEGYRDPLGQALAKQNGMSNADFGESPHNFRPSLAVDVCLDPRLVTVTRHPKDRTWPWLWDDISPEAVQAWADLEVAAANHGLDRVVVDGDLDRPHLQLYGWRRFIAS